MRTSRPVSGSATGGRKVGKPGSASELVIHPDLSVRWAAGRPILTIASADREGPSGGSLELPDGAALTLLSNFSVPRSPQECLRNLTGTDRLQVEKLIGDWTEQGVLVSSERRLPHPEVFPRDLARETEFLRIHRKCRDYGSTSAALDFALCQSLEYLRKHNIAGDIAETGVWKGASIMFCALFLLARQDTARRLYLYDVFDMSWPEPRPVDSSRYGNTVESRKSAFREQERSRKADPVKAKRTADEFYEQVRENIFSTGYPADRITFVRGYVEQTLPATLPDKLALLRLDTDWYESTRHALEHLYPRLVPGGVLLIDDYPTELGATTATDEYFNGLDEPIFLGRVDWQGRIGIKPRRNI